MVVIKYKMQGAEPAEVITEKLKFTLILKHRCGKKYFIENP